MDRHRVRIVQQMWKRLEPFVSAGGTLDIDEETNSRAQTAVRGHNVRGGLAALGLLEKVRQRTFRLTPAGLSIASEGVGSDPAMRGTAERALADALAGVLSHPVFREWIKDPTMPRHFRDAGHFWGIAPGTPPGVIRTRIADVDNTLIQARSLLDKKGVEEIIVRQGRPLFDRSDLERAVGFQAMLKQRFAKDVAMLQTVVG